MKLKIHAWQSQQLVLIGAKDIASEIAALRYLAGHPQLPWALAEVHNAGEIVLTVYRGGTRPGAKE